MLLEVIMANPGDRGGFAISIDQVLEVNLAGVERRSFASEGSGFEVSIPQMTEGERPLFRVWQQNGNSFFGRFAVMLDEFADVESVRNLDQSLVEHIRR